MNTQSNELHYKDEDGQEQVGIYDPVKRSGGVSYINPAGLAVQVIVQFSEAAGKIFTQTVTQTVYPGSTPASDPLETRFFAFGAAGNLFGFSATAKKDGLSYAAYVSAAADGGWNISYSETRSGMMSLFHLGGLIRASDAGTLASKSMEELKQFGLEKASIKTELRTTGGFFAIQSYRGASGEFEDKIYFTIKNNALTSYLVKGVCDVQSDETDDIYFSAYQTDLGLGAGYALTFGEWVKDGKPNGYGLLVQKDGQTVGVVDFPREDLLTINHNGADKIFQAAISPTGQMRFTDVTAQVAAARADISGRHNAAEAALVQMKAALDLIESSLESFGSAGSGDALIREIELLSQEITAFDPDPSVLSQAQSLASQAAGLAASLDEEIPYRVSQILPRVGQLRADLEAAVARIRSLKDQAAVSKNFAELLKIRSDVTVQTDALNGGADSIYARGISAISSEYIAQFNAKTSALSGLEKVRADMAVVRDQAQSMSLSKMRESIHEAGDPIASKAETLKAEASLADQSLVDAAQHPIVSPTAMTDAQKQLQTIGHLNAGTAVDGRAAELRQSLAVLAADIARFDVTAVRAAIADWARSVEASGSAAGAILDAVAGTSDFKSLEDYLAQINAIDARFDAGTSDSHVDALNALKAQVTALLEQRAGLVSRFQNLQSQLTALTADAVAVAKSKPINTYKGWTDSPYATVDAQTGMTKLLFMFADYNFFDFLSSGGVEAVDPAGTTMDGHHHNANPFESSDLYLSYLVPVQNAQGQTEYVWSAPKNLGLNTNKSDSSAMISADGKTVWLSRPVSEGSSQVGIEVATLNADGVTWTQSKVSIPKAPDEFSKTNPHISEDGRTLYYNVYYDRNKDGQTDMGDADLYYSVKNPDGTWSAPISMGPNINTSGFQDQIWVNAAGDEAYYTDGIANYYTKKVNGVWQPGQLLLFGGKLVFGAEPSFTENGNRIYFMKIDQELRTIVLVTAYKLPDGTWSDAVPVEKAF